MSAVNIGAVQRTMRVLLEREGRPILYGDPADGAVLALDPETAASPDGYLPAILVAGEAVWREATGKGFDLDIVRDRKGLLGFRLRRIGAGSFATVMLAAMEAMHQVARSGPIAVNELNALWTAAEDRIERALAAPSNDGAGPGP